MAEAVAEVGSTANNYQILGRLATGGMAEIFLARGMSATGVERHCVLKRILRNRASDVGFVRMFLDEARLAAQLQHPNVAQVYDIGKLGDSYFFTMEYVHGETVRAIMQRARSLRRELPLASVLTIIAGAASGLHHAHERIGMDGRPLQIVHRDVSPSNLMVSYEGGVKVVDFGVAKASDRASETRSGTVKGKISYLSPEQARGVSGIDRRSDMFSLGIVFWEMLTTERLYKRSSDFENMTAIVTEPTPPPSSRRKWIPPELDQISLKLLAKDPKERFQNAEELIEAIESFAGRSGTMISSSALSRFLREMFGQRPEPWVEMDTMEVPENVTVTSEPIPAELAIPVDVDVDLDLARVPTLERESERSVSQVDDQIDVLPTPLTGVMTARQARVEPDQIPTTPHPKIANPLVTTLNDAAPPPPRQTPNPSQPPPIANPRSPVAQTIAGTGMPNYGSGQHARVGYSSGQTPSRGSAPLVEPTASNLVYPRATPLHTGVDEPEPKRKGVGWQLFTVIAIAAVIGSVTMWFVMRNRGAEKSQAKVAAVTADAAEPVIEIDAIAPAVQVDAFVEPAVQVDAFVEPPPPVDAEVAVVEPPPPPPAVVPKEKKPPPVVEKPKPKNIETSWNDGNYKDVVARCGKAFPSGADDVRCVLAACKLRLEGKARTFYVKVDKSKRKSLVAACKNNDVDLEDKPTEKKPPLEKKDPCESDPMSCQH